MHHFLVRQCEEQYIANINYYSDVSSQSEHSNMQLNSAHPLADTLHDFSQQN